MSLSKNVTITVGGNEYVATLPLSGQRMDICNLKVNITDGKYETFKYSLDPDFRYEALKADSIATFNILIPQLRTDLKVKSMMHLDDLQMAEIVYVYENDFLPWYEEWQAVLAKQIVEANKERDELRKGDK